MSINIKSCFVLDTPEARDLLLKHSEPINIDIFNRLYKKVSEIINTVIDCDGYYSPINLYEKDLFFITLKDNLLNNLIKKSSVYGFFKDAHGSIY